jgi:polyisoprenoid-binding protein YceI
VSGVRQVNNVELPAAGVWTAIPGHADLHFVVRHMGLSKVRGRFSRLDVAVTIDEDPARSSLELTVDMTSVETGEPSRDKHLQSADFFDVANFPVATYRSTGLQLSGQNAVVAGQLTIRDITQTVRLDVTYLGHATDPAGKVRALFSASTTVNREDWKLSWNRVLDTGGLMISKEVKLEVEIELGAQQ